MGRRRIQVTYKTSAEIKESFNSKKELKQGYRLYAVYQVSIGKQPRELEETYNVSFKTINNWVHRYNKYGIEGLLDKEKPGRKPRLSEEQKKDIKDIILNKSPEIFGYNSATWTGALIIDYININYQVEYKKAQIYNIFEELGLSFQKGKGVYPEPNPEKRKERIEELKKTIRNWNRLSRSIWRWSWNI